MRLTPSLFAALLLVVPGTGAQTIVPADSRVRATLQDGEQVIGRIAEVRGDTLVVIRDGLLRHSRARLHADQVTRVDVSRGKYVSAERVISGGLLGALVGLVVVRLMPESNTVRCSGDVCTSKRREWGSRWRSSRRLCQRTVRSDVVAGEARRCVTL
jgi:hypothetical protein